MSKIHLDLETRSAVDLRKTGVHVYAADPSTDVWCMAYAIDDGPVEIWRRGEPFPEDLYEKSMNFDTLYFCHNAAFECAMWSGLLAPRLGWPPLPIERVRCTMAMAYAMALPPSLEQAAAAVGLDLGKDMDGRTLMLKLAKPRRFNPDGSIVWWDTPESLERLYSYCKQDVEVERRLETRLSPLSDAEQALWVLDQKINNRGIYVDLPAVTKAMDVVEVAKERLDVRMALATAGSVSRCSKVIDLKEWLGTLGVDADGLAKADVVELLDRDDLPAAARLALELRREAAKSSTAKLKAMTLAANADGRCRGLNQYHGATTGRWAGRRIQTQNFPRSSMHQIEIDDVLDLLSGGA